MNNRETQLQYVHLRADIHTGTGGEHRRSGLKIYAAPRSSRARRGEWFEQSFCTAGPSGYAPKPAADQTAQDYPHPRIRHDSLGPAQFPFALEQLGPGSTEYEAWRQQVGPTVQVGDGLFKPQDVPSPLTSRPVGARAAGRLVSSRSGLWADPGPSVDVEDTVLRLGLSDDARTESPGRDVSALSISPEGHAVTMEHLESLAIHVPAVPPPREYLRATHTKTARAARVRGTAKQQALSRAARLWAF